MRETLENKKKSFETVKDALFNELKGEQQLTLNMSAEESLFTRFTQSKIRQITSVSQGDLEFTLQEGNKKLSCAFGFTGDKTYDLEIALDLLKQSQKDLPDQTEDINTIALKDNGSSCEEKKANLLDIYKSSNSFLKPLESIDGAGLYVSGPVARANANNLGQNHFYSTESFYVDYSLYSKSQQAVKDIYADTSWNETTFKNKINTCSEQLKLMNNPIKKVNPGKYRVYLSPAATNDFVSMLGWNGLSFQGYKQGSCALTKLFDKKCRLSSQVNISEDFSLNLIERFNSRGELTPMNTDIIKNGELENLLISSNSAKEYGVSSNGADSSEYPRALIMRPGDLKEENILKELGTGIYLSNLHYLNWSDLPNARITGMTRYACFWVENGEIVAPIEQMRFDETFYNALGDNLVAITDFSEISPETCTYYSRGIGGSSFPGVIINDFNLTL